MRRLAAGVLLTPAVLVTLIAFILPMAWLARLSLAHVDAGVLVYDVTLRNYARFFMDRFYLGVLWRSVWLALSVAVLSVLAAYPLALFLTRTRSRWRGLLLVVCIAPLLVSSVVRTFGWM